MTQVSLLVAAALGAAIGFALRHFFIKMGTGAAETKARELLESAKKKSQEELLSAKNKALSILEEAQKKAEEEERQVRESLKRIDKREEILNRRMEEIDKEREEIKAAAEKVRSAKTKVEKAGEEAARRLEKIAGLSREQAKEVLLQLAEEKYRRDLAERKAKLAKISEEELEKEANTKLAEVIQKCSRSHASEALTTTVNIPSEEVKGKIIGKEGRNIRVFERLTGVEVVIDDTPDSVVLSAFDPIRRETAKVTLENLLRDGRVHPAKIEEMYAEAEKEIDKRIREAGEAAAYEAGVVGLDPKLIYLLGRLRYRTSYKQNVLLHSLEVSFIAAALAAELGLDVKTAKVAGLLHDIGKALSHEVQGTHVNIGIKILQKFGVDQAVIDAMKSHHEEYPYASPEAYLVTAADAVSAGRPGARKDTVENYIKRMEELEELVNSFADVQKCYAISAGREVRIFVKPEEVDDLGAMRLAREVAAKIEKELTYPGEIKVNVLREKRAVEYAK
ncbi:MAG TPA: ribonuclease Y [Candidatus Moranbacteria bacterium]|nr:ribonuclease Y [Candidatus Moranbacteria bacterium]